MLRALSLRDFVIVEALDIELATGFTALTGETGAGKSILVDALGLVLGARAEPAVIRAGADRADIAAEFDLGGAPAARAWLAANDHAAWTDEIAEANDLEDEGGESCLLRRTIDRAGRSRGFVNGRPATAAQLRDLGELLVDIHGQHATQSMMRADGQRELLDAFGGCADAVREIGRLHAQWRRLAADLERAERAGRELLLERERLEWQVNEIEQLKLAPDEWQALNQEQKQLAHAAALIDGARAGADLLAERDDAVSSQLYQLLQRLRPLAEVDTRLANSVGLIESAQIQLDEAASDLAGYADRVDADPQRLEAVDRRIGAIFSAARKFKLAPEALAGQLDEWRQRLADVVAAADIDALRQKAEAARADYDRAAAALTKQRKAAARKLSAGVVRNIHQLGMTGGRFEVVIEPGDPTASGADRVEFRIAAHAGAAPRPLAKVASGGELSRVGLAIAVLAAETNPVPTLIFDEADAGVGGAVAEVIGELMRRLGASHQVFCVTHLPQVAAKAHHHFAVSKETAGERTVSRVTLLDRTGRVEEIARMLGGVDITTTTRKHARELLAQA